jgi:multiple sugar transport system substrate-binding protein
MDKSVLKLIHSAAAVLVGSMIAAGCGKGEPGAGTKAASPDNSTEPVTITFYNAANPDEYYQQYIETHIKKKLPHITINYIREGKGNTLTDLIGAGTTPDLIYLVSNRISEYKKLGMLGDLTPMVAKQKIDLLKMQNGLIDSIKSYGEKGELLAMPWGLSNYAMYYNKDIFDKFGIGYPVDGMTWEQVYQLAAKLTRVDGGQQYRGFDFGPTFFLGFNQLSLPYVDPKTEKAAVGTDAWRQIFETYGKFYRIPGNESNPQRTENDFYGNKTLAMRAGTTMFPVLLDLEKKGQPMNFDIVSFPTFPEAPKTGLQTVTAGFGLPPHSKHKEQAMQIISLMLSEEVQKEGAEIFRLPVIRSEAAMNAIGKFYPSLAKINVKALTYNTNALTKVVTPYDDIAKSVMVQKFNEFKQGSKDVNTVLREAEADINKKITEEKSK